LGLNGQWSIPPHDGLIVLARHGRPALDRSCRLNWREYEDWWGHYDEGGLAEDQTPPDALMAHAAGADVILASPLQRSLETARAIAGHLQIETDTVFIEAALPPPPIPGLRLKPQTWGVLARISWWLGLSRGRESRKQAEDRAHQAVARVLHAVGEGRTVVVCAHGWFNRMMRPVLLAHGWQCVRDGRDHYWSFREYRPRAS
jgi:broad specificity phosphatase PhoE